MAPELLEALGELRETASACGALAQRLSGEPRRQVRSIHQALEREFRGLSGLYRLLTGDRPRLPPQPLRGRQGTPSQVTAWILRRLERSAGDLEALGGRSSGETRSVLMASAKRMRSLFRELLDVLGRGL